MEARMNAHGNSLPEVCGEQSRPLERKSISVGVSAERVEAARPPITYRAEDGSIATHGDYREAVERLCELEEQRGPGERYTFRSPDGTPRPRRGIEMVLGRLHSYETEGK